MADWVPSLTVEAMRRYSIRANVAYVGELPIEFIDGNAKYSRTNWMTRKKVKAIIGITGFVAPLILDPGFKVIDGQLRLELVKELHQEGHYTSDTVPVVVFDVGPAAAVYLRIVCNRMGEFPRWNFEAKVGREDSTPEGIPEFVDHHPQLQALLEPLGFFTVNRLPEAFYEETILNFPQRIESPLYRTEIGLAKWSEIQKQINIKRLSEESKSPLKPPGDYVNIFTLKASPDDYVPTHAIEDEAAKFIHRMKEVAETVTDTFDKQRRAEKAAKGQSWQTSRRTAKQMDADYRAEENSS